MSLRKQLTLILCGFALLPLLFFGAVDYSMSVAHLKAAAMRELTALSDIQRERLLNQVNQHKQKMLMIAQAPAVTQAAYAVWQGDADNNSLGSALEEALSLAPNVTEAHIYGPANTLQSRVFGAGYHSQTPTDGRRYSEISLSHDTNGQALLVDEAPIYHSGKFVGRIRLYTNAEPLLHIFTDYSGMGETGESILIQPDQDLRVKALHKRRYNDSGELTYNPFRAPFNSNDKEAYDVFDYRGEAVLLVGQFLPELNWGFIVKRDISEILGPAKAMLSRLNIFIIAIAGLSIIIALRAAAIIHRPVAKLTQTAERIRTGDLRKRADESGHNEMAVLGRAINGMLDQLIDDNTQLEKAVAQRTFEAESARERAEENSRLQSEFLANMSHEVRTPLNGIMGIASILKRSVSDDRTQEYLDIIENSGQNLLVIIDDILELSRANTGQLCLHNDDFVARDAFSTVLKSSAEAAKEKGLAFTVAFSNNVPHTLHGDATRLTQVLKQLLSNALKFTRSGNIEVNISWSATSASRGQLCLSVTDTGIGIPPSKQQDVFKPFVQADGGSTRRYGGNGLGLSIASHIVALMDGRIDVTSAENRGTTFTVTTDLLVAESAPLASQRTERFSSKPADAGATHIEPGSPASGNVHQLQPSAQRAAPTRMRLATAKISSQAATLAFMDDCASLAEPAVEDDRHMILDEQRLRDITRNKPALITSISQLFIDELPDMLQSVDDAYTKGERDELAQAVHRLKSALGNFATQEYYRDISGLEAMAKESGEPLSLWREKWDTVTLKLQLLENELKDIAGL